MSLLVVEKVPEPEEFKAAKTEGIYLSAILKERAKIKIELTKTMPIRTIGESLKRHLIA